MTAKSTNEPSQSQAQQQSADTAGPFSINEPPGTTIGVPTPPPEPELPALVLTSILPDTAPIQADGLGVFALTVTGSGFTADSVIVFDETDMETVYVSDTELRSDNTPIGTVPATVDVEVARGEDLSEVITFDFTDIVSRGTRKVSERKPSKGKRDKTRAKTKRR